MDKPPKGIGDSTSTTSLPPLISFSPPWTNRRKALETGVVLHYEYKLHSQSSVEKPPKGIGDDDPIDVSIGFNKNVLRGQTAERHWRPVPINKHKPTSNFVLRGQTAERHWRLPVCQPIATPLLRPVLRGQTAERHWRPPGPPPAWPSTQTSSVDKPPKGIGDVAKLAIFICALSFLSSVDKPPKGIGDRIYREGCWRNIRSPPWTNRRKALETKILSRNRLFRLILSSVDKPPKGIGDPVKGGRVQPGLQVLRGQTAERHWRPFPPVPPLLSDRRPPWTNRRKALETQPSEPKGFTHD